MARFIFAVRELTTVQGETPKAGPQIKRQLSAGPMVQLLLQFFSWAALRGIPLSYHFSGQDDSEGAAARPWVWHAEGLVERSH